MPVLRDGNARGSNEIYPVAVTSELPESLSLRRCHSRYLDRQYHLARGERRSMPPDKELPRTNDSISLDPGYFNNCVQ
ncbi:hypothetical protein GCM10022235_85690 [Kribbella ginsengisoli]|uniref:Uncharacterized protein n=1 Tax=Kribbella ginsengisoli TaxID=363865 RepID=A0ABP6Z7W6_9ACTN